MQASSPTAPDECSIEGLRARSANAIPRDEDKNEMLVPSLSSSPSEKFINGETVPFTTTWTNM